MNFTNNRMVDGAPAIQQQGSVVPPAFHPQIMRSVRMHPVLAALVGGFVFLAVLGYALTRKPVYKAESLVYEEPAAAKLMSDGTTGTFDPSRYESYLDEQKQILARPDVLRAAIATLPEPVWHELGPNEEAAAASLQAQLKADRVKTSYQLSIGLESSDPAAAAAIVNAVTKAYLDAVHKDSAAQTDQRTLLLAEERGRIESELAATRREQAGLSASLGVASPLGETANPYDFEIASVRQQMLTARESHDVAAAQLNSISGEAALTTAADEAILGDPSLASMRATVSARRATLNGQMAGMKPENPVYKQDMDELADLDKTLDTVTQQSRSKAERQLQEKLRTELERTGDVESRLNAQLGRLTATATTAAPKLQRAAELSQDLTRLNTRYAAVDDTLRSLQLEANGPGVVRLSLAAAVPTAAEPNRKMLMLAAAPVLGAICGIAAAVFARKRDRRIYSPRDVEDVLGFAPMAVLPAKDDVSMRVMDEYVLRLAAGLEGAYRGSGAQTFLLTAASAATDIRPLRKALTAKLERIGLDVSVASTTDLLLADPDVARRAVYHMARPGDGAGFVSGHLAKLKGEYAMVIINAPPLGTSAETEYVARCADATVLIAESGVTTHEELYESAALLQRLEARGVGAVLQGLHLRLADESFRHAVDAVEQRQPDMYDSTVRSKPVVVEDAQVWEQAKQPVQEPIQQLAWEPEVDYVAPRQRPPVMPTAAVVYPYGWAPGKVEEPVAEVVPQATIVPTTEPAPSPGLRLVEPLHEKMSAKLSEPRETSDGEASMSGSKSWFQRMLHRDDERVTIIPDGDDDDEPMDEASFLTSRISRSIPAYEAAAAEDSSLSKRFVLEDLHPIKPEDQQPEIEELPVAAEATIVEAVAETPQQQIAPAPVVAPVTEASEPDFAATEMRDPAIEVMSSTRLLSRLRPAPARPLSFHELAGIAQPEAAPEPMTVAPVAAVAEIAAPIAVTEEVVSGPIAAKAQEEMVHAVELPTELSVAHEEPVHEESLVEVHAAEPILATPVLEEPAPQTAVEEPVMEEPVVAEPAFATKTEPEPVAKQEQPGSITKEIARIASGMHNVGTSRWDPIPPLRPTDSGWNRVRAIDGGNGNGSSNSSEYTGVERRRSGEWTWTSRDSDTPTEIEVGAQHWAEQAAAAETDEPALSRPWGLLSRFQQTHMIAPARKNGSSNGASSNGSGGQDHDRELEPDSVRPERNG